MYIEESFWLLGSPQVNKGAVELHTVFELCTLALEAKVDAMWVLRQRCHVNIRFLFLFSLI